MHLGLGRSSPIRQIPVPDLDEKRKSAKEAGEEVELLCVTSLFEVFGIVRFWTGGFERWRLGGRDEPLFFIAAPCSTSVDQSANSKSSDDD